MQNLNKVVLLTGPGGSGKSTIAQLLVDRLKFTPIDGDQLDTEFFPDGGQWYPENSINLQKAHDKILRSAKEAFDRGENVVIDYIIFGDYLSFINKAKILFGQQFELKVLFPSEKETLKRDTRRTSWHTGIDRIRVVRNEFELIKNQIGAECYFDTSGQTAEETFLNSRFDYLNL